MHPLCILAIKDILQEKIKNLYKYLKYAFGFQGFNGRKKIFPLIQENIGPEVREVFK